MDVGKMSEDLAKPEEGPDGGAEPAPAVDHESGKTAMAELSSALKSGDHEAAWHAFQGAMACAGCDLGDGASDGEPPAADGQSEDDSEE